MPHLSPKRRLAALFAALAAFGSVACVTAAERLEMGIADVEAGRIEQGIVAIEKELEGDGLDDAGRARAHAFAGHGWMLLREPDRALDHYRSGRALDPEDPWLCYASGVALHDLGRPTEAVAAFTSALRLDSDHVKSLQWRAETRIALGEFEGASADLERVLAILDRADPKKLAEWDGDPRMLRVWTLKRHALCMGIAGDRAGADRDFAEAARIEAEMRR